MTKIGWQKFEIWTYFDGFLKGGVFSIILNKLTASLKQVYYPVTSIIRLQGRKPVLANFFDVVIVKRFYM